MVFISLSAGFLHGFIILSTFVSVVLMPLGEAMTLILACPIFTAILARIFLGHRLMGWKIFFGIILFVGIFLVLQPPFLFPPEGGATNVTSEI